MSAIQPRAGILNIRPHMEGLPPLTGRVIKLASNESAFGPSPAALAAARTAAAEMTRYPEQGTGALQRAIAERFGLDAERIVCGPGSDELLGRITRAYLEPGDELVFSANGYAKFRNYAWAAGATPVAARDRAFRADVDAILDAVTPRTRIVALANPDNPTGSYLPGGEMRRLRSELPERVLLIVDSAYAEYVTAPDYECAQRLIDALPGVVMTRTFSKIFGMAGLRLGWLYATPEVVDVMRRTGATFPISGIALAAGVAALEDRAHTERVRSQTLAARAAFAEALRALGLQVHPSETNFLLVEFGAGARGTAAEAYAALLADGIIARRFPAPAFADCLRISVGTSEDMDAARLCLNAFLRAA